MKITLAQINATVGDIAGNEAKILYDAYARSVAAGAGRGRLRRNWPSPAIRPVILVLNPAFVAENLAAFWNDSLKRPEKPPLVRPDLSGVTSTIPERKVTNAIALLQHGKIVTIRTKTLLPTYDVFDEDRYFEPRLRRKFCR